MDYFYQQSHQSGGTPLAAFHSIHARNRSQTTLTLLFHEQGATIGERWRGWKPCRRGHFAGGALCTGSGAHGDGWTFVCSWLVGFSGVVGSLSWLGYVHLSLQQ